MFVDVQGSGPHVVLIHGLGAHHFSWRHTVAVLKSGYTTHAVDLLGFGASTPPSGFGDSMEEQADAVIAYLKNAGISSFGLIGHSMGGAVSLFMVDKLKSDADLTIENLTLIAPVAYPPPISSFVIDFPILPGIPLSFISVLGAKIVLQGAYFDDDKITVRQLDTYAKNLATSDRLDTFLSHARKLEDISALEPKYPSFDLETKIIWGRQDKVLKPSDFANRLESDLPNATLTVIDDCGHIPQEECPVETNSEIEAFLSAGAN